MLTTTRPDLLATRTLGADPGILAPNELTPHYDALLADRRMSWTIHHGLGRLLGAGGQGVVYLTERRGADGFTLPVAVKIFSPERYEDARSYEETMARMARVASKVAQIQHDILLDLHDFVDRNRIRMMFMEWVDGYDLQKLLAPETLERIQSRVSVKRWEYLNSVVVTTGPSQSRFKPGVAVAIIRECLGGLAALHRDGIVHGDVKPSNVMLKCTGSAKIVDIGSAFDVQDPPATRSCTPAYAAPEVLEGAVPTPRSDLASLGYVLVELLAGRQPFCGFANYRDLLEAKRSLPRRLPELLPREVTVNELLMNFCRGLIAPDPNRRFPSAEAADLVDKSGAAAFLRQLVMSNLASEYDNEIRLWLGELKQLDSPM